MIDERKRRRPLDVVGLPDSAGLMLLGVALIMLLSPYVGGADFGIFKVPEFSFRNDAAFKLVGPIATLFSLGTFAPILPKRNDREVVNKGVESTSKYRLQSISEIVEIECASSGLSVDGISIGDRLHVDDLIRICSRERYPAASGEEVARVVNAARATAFSRKYAAPREDEKLVDPTKINLPGLKPWHVYFRDALQSRGISELVDLDVLVVGIGNGHADESVLGGVRKFAAVDISEDALRYADGKYPQMTRHVCPAERLEPIANGSIDLYLSLRTYQSTLFNRRSALHEARRVLRSGGILVLSIPTMFLQADGTPLLGLIPPNSTVPSMRYAESVAGRIQDYMRTLNFREVQVESSSPFEIYVMATR